MLEQDKIVKNTFITEATEKLQKQPGAHRVNDRCIHLCVLIVFLYPSVLSVILLLKSLITELKQKILFLF